jgi:enoyl-CoA hydratase/carnithine racemase
LAYETVLVAHADAVSTLTLNRPPVNAVSPGLMQDVLAALDELEAPEPTRCIVLTGSGATAFSAGADFDARPVFKGR